MTALQRLKQARADLYSVECGLRNCDADEYDVYFELIKTKKALTDEIRAITRQANDQRVDCPSVRAEGVVA